MHLIQIMWLLFWIPNTITKLHEVCFAHIGCFSLDPPWRSFWRLVPLPPEKLRIEFYVLTRNTINKSVEDWKVTLTEAYRPIFGTLKDVDFQRKRPQTVIQIYGVFRNNEVKWERLKNMAKAYLSQRDVNVMVIEWDALTARHAYRRSVSNTRIVAAVAVKFLESLVELSYLTADKIHLVGSSLGAHIAGYIGKAIPNVHRITALDAAQPGFEYFDPRVRLHRTDAQYVDVLHTNARPFFLSLGLGYVAPLGDVDFYFNGGAHQPGCFKFPEAHPSMPTGIFNPKRAGTTMVYVLCRCSHFRAIEYWIEALESKDCIMWGVKKTKLSSHEAKLGTAKQYLDHSLQRRAEDFSSVGLDTFSRTPRGVFHVRTHSRKPFCQKYPQYDKFKNTLEASISQHIRVKDSMEASSSFHQRGDKVVSKGSTSHQVSEIIEVK